MGLAATGHVVASAILVRWFVKRRGTVVGVLIIGGFGMGGSLAMTSALTGDIFGRFYVGSIFGLIFLVHQAGGVMAGRFFLRPDGRVRGRLRGGVRAPAPGGGPEPQH